METKSLPHDQVRNAIVEAAVRLLAGGGAAALTTRAVARAAGVQAPTIYRLFGDKDGMLDAVAERVMATYVAETSASAENEIGDPVDDLRAGWQLHMQFGLANPDLYVLLTSPARGRRSSAAAAGARVLRARVHRLAEAGRLRVDERRAVDLVHAAGTGALLTLLAKPAEERHMALADALFEAVVEAILLDTPVVSDPGALPLAVAFSTTIPQLRALTEAERGVLAEWVDRSVACLQGE